MWDKDSMAFGLRIEEIHLMKMTHFWRSRMALNSWALAKVTKAWKGRSDGDGSVFGGGKGQLWSKMMEQHLSCPLQYHPCITIHHVPTNATSVSESTHKYHLYITKFLQIPPLHHRSPCTHKHHLCIRKYSKIPPLCKFLQAGYIWLRNPGIRDWRKWRPKVELGEREREKSVAFVCKMI